MSREAITKDGISSIARMLPRAGSTLKDNSNTSLEGLVDTLFVAR